MTLLTKSVPKILLALLFLSACFANLPVSQVEKQPQERNTSFISVPMNDPLLPQQTYLYETGIVKAWSITTGNPDLKVAIIDGEIKQRADLYATLTRLYSMDAPAIHATPIAGIIGAAQNNGIGMAGITKCQILSYVAQTTLDPLLGDFRIDAVERSFYQAVADGAQIINCSFGINSDLSVVRAAVFHATQRGVVVVAAVGNSGQEFRVYPAA